MTVLALALAGWLVLNVLVMLVWTRPDPTGGPAGRETESKHPAEPGELRQRAGRS